jgi:hypothetical protein
MRCVNKVPSACLEPHSHRQRECVIKASSTYYLYYLLGLEFLLKIFISTSSTLLFRIVEPTQANKSLQRSFRTCVTEVALGFWLGEQIACLSLADSVAALQMLQRAESDKEQSYLPASMTRTRKHSHTS